MRPSVPDYRRPPYWCTHVAAALTVLALVGAAAQAIAQDVPPVVTVPASRAVDEGSLLSFSVTASDPDGDAITSLTASPLPPGATFTVNPGNGWGAFNWTPYYNQAGAYSVTISAASACRPIGVSQPICSPGTAVTAITVNDVDRVPIVTAPASETVNEGGLLTFGVNASDPDGEPLTALTALPLPPGATFIPSTGYHSGTFRWWPGPTQSGVYSVTISAQGACRPTGVSSVVCPYGSATTEITVFDVDRLPVVVAPPGVESAEGSLIRFTATASDPDGLLIESLAAFGLPPGATFVVAPGFNSGTFNWTPDYSQAGVYGVTIAAESACRPDVVSGTACARGTTNTQITVTDVNRPPLVVAPVNAVVQEGSLLTFTVSVSDPDGEPIQKFFAWDLPTDGTFVVDASNMSGTLRWTPSLTQAGRYYINFTAVTSLVTIATTQVTVLNVDRPPAIDAPSSVDGPEGSPIRFVVLASDPDEEPIESLTAEPLPHGATFSVDQGNAMGTFDWTPDFTQSGVYSVTLSAASACRAVGTSSPVCAVTTAMTQITVSDVSFPARAFTAQGNSTVRLSSEKATWCVQIEPNAQSYLNTGVDLGSIRLSYADLQVPAALEKTMISSDTDKNGVDEITACFTKADLRSLFGNLPEGRRTVTATLDGRLTTGGEFHAQVTFEVVSSGPGLVASLSPSLPGPTATLSFSTRLPGPIHLRLFDLHGRMVRTLMAGDYQPAGYHDVSIDGLNDRGERLPSGVYFYRIEAQGDVGTGRFVMVR